MNRMAGFRCGGRYAQSLCVVAVLFAPTSHAQLPAGLSVPTARSETTTVRISPHEVTVAEFRQFVDATSYVTDAERAGGCASSDEARGGGAKSPARSWRAPGFDQGESHPVVCISWNDAHAFLAWRNRAKPGHRLPTADELTSVLRPAGAALPWGSDIRNACRHANVSRRAAVADPSWPGCDDGHTNTAPVGSLAEDAPGLWDVSGNVRELTQTCQMEARIDLGDARLNPQRCRSWVVIGSGFDSDLTLADPLSPLSSEQCCVEASEASVDRGFRWVQEIPR